MRNQAGCTRTCVLAMIVCSFWTAASAGATEDISGNLSPIIKFEEKEYDFGTVKQAEEVTHLFEFRNLGQAALKIDRVTTTCGCTAVAIADSTIPPDGSGEIMVTFNSKGYSRPFQKNIYVHSNDPEYPVVALDIKGFVKTEVYLLTPQLDFGEVKSGTSVDSALVVVDERTDEKPLVITELETNVEYIHLAIGKPEHQQSGRFFIPIAVNLDSLAPAGRLRGRIELHTNAAQCPVMEVPVIADVIDEIAIFPQRLSFGYIRRGDTQPRKVTIHSRWKMRFKVLKVESNLPFLSIQLLSVKEAKEYEVTASIKKDAPKGKVAGVVSIYTDYPGQAVIEVPVSGFLGP